MDSSGAFDIVRAALARFSLPFVAISLRETVPLRPRRGTQVVCDANTDPRDAVKELVLPLLGDHLAAGAVLILTLKLRRRAGKGGIAILVKATTVRTPPPPSFASAPCPLLPAPYSLLSASTPCFGTVRFASVSSSLLVSLTSSAAGPTLAATATAPLRALAPHRRCWWRRASAGSRWCGCWRTPATSAPSSRSKARREMMDALVHAAPSGG